jgi:solute carrier family 25 S-adenosylmethionine transporter 26
MCIAYFCSFSLLQVASFTTVGGSKNRQRTQTSSRLSAENHNDSCARNTEAVSMEQSSRRRFLSFAATSALLSVTTSLSRAESVSAAVQDAKVVEPVKPPPSTKPTPHSRPNILISTIKKQVEESQTLEETISGFVAGAALTCTKTVVKYPLDTATVRLQMPNTEYSIRNLGRLFDGSFSGVVSPLVWNIPAGAIFFSVKDATKQALKQSVGAEVLPKWATTSLAVAAAQLPYWAVRNPSEVVKTKQQAGVKGFGEGVSALDAFQQVREESKIKNTGGTGLEGFYVGYWANILYAYPADVIKFVVYDSLTQGRKNLPPLEGAVAGAAATAVAQLVTTPLDVIRNRVMAGQKKTAEVEGSEGEANESYLESLVTLAREEGVLGLFAGTIPRVGKALLSGAIQFATYEETKSAIASFFGQS